MSFIQALALGILQGATEFLPVSSSGHLAIVEHLWSIDEGARLALAAVLHIGTALALLFFFAPRIGVVLKGFGSKAPDRRRSSWLMVGYIAVGTVPGALVGLLFAERLDTAFSSPALVGVMLLVTGAALLLTRFSRERETGVGWVTAAVVGLAQAAAVLPGISRSGATIAAALFLGLTRKDAFEFSFLLSIPIVLAAAIKEMVGLDYSVVGAGPLALGVVLAFGAGLGALVLLKRAVLAARLHWFAYYCGAAGLLVLLLVR